MKTLSIKTAARLSSLASAALAASFAMASQKEVPPPATAGAAFSLNLQKSRFDIGPNAQVGAQGGYKRYVGDKGVFSVDTITGATLAVPNAPSARPGAAAPKPGTAQSAGQESLPPAPEPLTTDPVAHNAVVKKYLLDAGVPAAEVAGEHVTTTMAGGGPISTGVQPSKSRLLFYTTHLERKLGGVPVENSYAFAALDKAGKAIVEGAFWPAIPADVVRQAQALQAKLASSAEQASFRAAAEAMAPGAEVQGESEVRIVHTNFDHHGKFEAKAVVTTIARSPFGGKAEIIRLDADRAVVHLTDEAPSKAVIDSPKAR